MSALLPSDDEVRAAFEGTIRKRDPWNVPSFGLTETGQAYASTWLEKEFRSFSSGYIAAWNRRAAPVVDAARTCTCHPDDNPPVPCAQKYAFSECAASAPSLPSQEDVARVSSAAIVDAMGCLRIKQTISGSIVDDDSISEATAAILALMGQTGDGWQDIASAPKDGTVVDLWFTDHRYRVANAWWGRPHHECGEAGQYCDSCPTYDGWCDDFGYLTGPDGTENCNPTHWRPLPAPPAKEGR